MRYRVLLFICFCSYIFHSSAKACKSKAAFHSEHVGECGWQHVMDAKLKEYKYVRIKKEKPHMKKMSTWKNNKIQELLVASQRRGLLHKQMEFMHSNILDKHNRSFVDILNVYVCVRVDGQISLPAGSLGCPGSCALLLLLLFTFSSSSFSWTRGQSTFKNKPQITLLNRTSWSNTNTQTYTVKAGY